jgi:cardiolipin synthase
MFALPNALTIMRIVLVPVFAVAFVMPGDAARLVAFGVFVIAGVSDWLDGFAARKLKAGSDFGRMLDPIADKVLVAVALMMLVAEGTFRRVNPETGASVFSLLRLVPALIILAREILVSGLREFLAELRVSLPVSQLAKWKTAAQMVAIAVLLLGDAAPPIVTHIGLALIWVAAGLTLITGYDYLRTGLRHMAEDQPAGGAQ